MNYRIAPLYKYLIFAAILFLFLKYYRQITPNRYILVTFFAVGVLFLLDYVLIDDHPNILDTGESFDLDTIIDNEENEHNCESCN